ncbi:MAG: LysE family translocator [Alphaproteobacteria bacterium]
MTPDLVLAAFVLILILGITPGPNNMMLAASGATFGFRRTVPHICGIVIGFPLLIVSVGLGAGQVFAVAPWLYPVMKWAGFLWLLWLAFRIAQSGPPDADGSQKGRPMKLWEAAAFQWINPKAWMMSLGVISIYAQPGPDYISTVLILGLISLTTSPISTTSWAGIGLIIARLFARAPKLVRAVNIALAILMILSVLPGMFETQDFPALDATEGAEQD